MGRKEVDLLAENGEIEVPEIDLKDLSGPTEADLAQEEKFLWEMGWNGDDSTEVNGDIQGVSVDDPVGLYFKQMAQEPLLTADEEIDLAKRIEAGRIARERIDDQRLGEERVLTYQQLIEEGQAAREHLGRANTRLVVSIAKRYMDNGLPFPDLIQEGNVGLMRAVDKFDHRRGARFSTYATWWIRQSVSRAIAQKVRTIRNPLHMEEKIRAVLRKANKLEQELGRRPTSEEIADRMESSASQVNTLLYLSRHTISLHTPVGEEGDDNELGDFVEDEESPNPVQSATQVLLEEHIGDVLGELTPRQAHILELRFGLGGGESHTLEEVANKYGLSRERIRQLEKEALRQLRHPRLANQLRDYLE